MARDQQDSGIYRPVPYGIWAVESPILAGAGVNHGVDDLARNCNTIWATRSPNLVQQVCPGDTSIRHIEVTQASHLERYYFRLPTGEYGSRDEVAGQLSYYTSDGSTTGEVQVVALQASLDSTPGNTVTTSIPASTSKTWVTIDNVVAATDRADGSEILEVSFQRTAGSGTLYVRGINFWVAPHSGELPSGVEANGFEALDLIQYDADSPLSAGNLKRLRTNHEVLYEGYRAPYACHCFDWQGTKNGMSTLTSTDYVPFCGPLLIYTRPGEDITHVRYYIFAYVPSGTVGSVTIEAQGAGGVIESDTHTVTAGTSVKTFGDWLSGTLELWGDYSQPTKVIIRGRTTSGVGSVFIKSYALWAEPRS